MRISKVSIRRPVTTLMVVFIVLILGVVSFARLQVDLLPDIELPIAVVSTTYSGAGPREVEEIVTKSIENAMATVDNVKTISSISSEGSSLVILEFNQGTNMDFATLDMREKLDFIKRLFPDDVSDPMVLKFDPNIMPMMSLGISSHDKEISELRTWIEEVLKPRLERLEGVASVSVFGGKEKEIKVVVDPDKLAAVGLSISDVAATLQLENANFPGGIITDGEYDLLVRATGQFKSVDEIRNLPVMTRSGATFLLKDIATVEEDFKDSSAYSRINGKDSLSISIQKESTANTVKVAGRVNKELEKIKKENPDIEIITILDQSEFINRSIKTVTRNAIIGAILAVVVLLAFLKNISPTLVIGTSIPIAIIATFVLIYFSKITLNIISLGGLALGVGMLVDNSIVVLENIYRLRQQGLDRIEAAEKGSNQVAMAITASTLTTVSVFLPVVFIEGITSEIFKQLALTVTFSLLASLVVALTLVPMLSSRLLRKENFQKRGRVLEDITKEYRKVLKWALFHRKSVIFATVIVFAISVALIPVVGTEFFPNVDQGQINISIQMPSGTRYEETVRVIQKVEETVSSIPEVDTVYANIGGSGMGEYLGSSAGDSGSVNVILKPPGERKRKTEEVAEEIRNKISKIAGASISVDDLGSMMGSYMGGIYSSDIEIEIKGDDLETLHRVADDIVKLVEEVEGTREVKSSFEEGMPELRIVLDRARASSYGINVAMVSAAVRNYLQGVVATRYRVGGRELDVRVQIPSERVLNIHDVEKIPITSPGGTVVPLKNIAEFEYDRSPASIRREDQTRMVAVSASVSGRPLGKVVADIEQKLQDYPLPEGYSIYFGGENELMNEALRDLGLALLLGIVLVYMIMASQFESLLHPFTIMFSIPLAFTGAFLGLVVTKNTLSVPALLGLIVLAGIVVNNGIVLVDYINFLRREGMDRNDAVMQAGATRLRPILMTALTTILGLVPMALGIGESSEIQMPLAVTVIGGLALSTVLTLVVVPVIYTIFDDVGKKVKGK